MNHNSIKKSSKAFVISIILMLVGCDQLDLTKKSDSSSTAAIAVLAGSDNDIIGTYGMRIDSSGIIYISAPNKKS